MTIYGNTETRLHTCLYMWTRQLDVLINELMSSSQVMMKALAAPLPSLERVEGRGERDRERERGGGGGGQRKRERE